MLRYGGVIHLKLALFMDASLEDMLRNGQLTRLIYYLRAYSERFTTIYLVSDDKEDMGRHLPSNCVHLRTGNTLAGGLLHTILAPLLFRRELKESCVYRVLGLFLKSMIPALFARYLYGRPVVATYQYHYSKFAEVEGGSPLVVLLTRLKESIGLILATRIIVTTESLRDYVERQVPRREVWLIPNGVALELFPFREEKMNYESSVRRILFVGRLTRQKNLFSLLGALRMVDRVRLIIVGEGPLEKGLMEYSREFGLNVEFQKYVPHDELREYYSSADAFVLPSLIEGHPKVLLEAMACGLPVVGADVDGIHEVITHEENGLLCDTEPESIRINARRLIAHEYDLSSLLSRETELMADLALSRREGAI